MQSIAGKQYLPITLQFEHLAKRRSPDFDQQKQHNQFANKLRKTGESVNSEQK
jgi:hypothetical protein